MCPLQHNGMTIVKINIKMIDKFPDGRRHLCGSPDSRARSRQCDGPGLCCCGEVWLYTLRCAFDAAVAALDFSRASAQSSSVIDVSPAKVPGPASICPPSIAIVWPVR